MFNSIVFNESDKIKENYYKMISQGCNYCDILYSKELVDSMPKKKMDTSNLTNEKIKERIKIVEQIVESVKNIFEKDDKTIKFLEQKIIECIYLIYLFTIFIYSKYSIILT